MIILALATYVDEKGKHIPSFIMNFGNLKQCEEFYWKKESSKLKIKFLPHNTSILWDSYKFFEDNIQEAMTLDELREYYED